MRREGESSIKNSIEHLLLSVVLKIVKSLPIKRKKLHVDLRLASKYALDDIIKQSRVTGLFLFLT